MKSLWKDKRVGEVLTLEYGKPLDDVDRKPDGLYPVYGANGEKDRSDKYYFDKPSIIVGRKGSAGEVNFSDEKFWPLDVTYFVTFDEQQHDLRFLYYLLTTLDLPSLAKGVKPGINRNEVYSKAAKIPPLNEQQRVVGILDEAFDGLATATANAEQNLRNARALFESHLQSVFTQRRKGWVEKRLGDVCERVSVGHVGPTSRFYCDASKGVPFLRSQNVRPGRLDYNGLQYITPQFHWQLRKSTLRPGDVLFVRVGANRGDCCVVPDDVGEINCANVVFARPERGSSDYVALFCRSTMGRERLLGMTTGAAQGVINTGSVAELMVPMPNATERATIVSQLDNLAAETKRLEAIYQQKLAALGELKKSLLHQAFSGQL